MSNRSSCAHTLVAELVLPEVELDAPAPSARCANAVLPWPRHATMRPATRTVVARSRRPPGSAAIAAAVSCVRSKPYANGGDARRHERVELLAPRLQDEVQLVAHAALPRPLAAVLLQVRLDERIDAAVHDLLHVGDLQLGAVVVDHRVRLEDVAADLAAEADVRLGRVQLRLLRQPACSASIWYSRFFSIFIAVALFLNCDRCCCDAVTTPARNVRDAHRGAGLVHVLAAGARRAEDVDLEVLVADLDVDLRRPRPDRRTPTRSSCAGAPASRTARCARADARPLSALRKPNAYWPLISSTAPLMPGFLALAQVEDLDRVALPLRPARVHAHEHLRPVLRLGAAGAGADLELRVAEVVRAATAASEARNSSSSSPMRVDLRDRPPPPSPRRARPSSSSSSSRALCDAADERLERLDPALQRLHLLHDVLRAPPGCSRSPALPIRASSVVSVLPLVIEVKDTSSARRADRRTMSAAARARFPP